MCVRVWGIFRAGQFQEVTSTTREAMAIFVVMHNTVFLDLFNNKGFNRNVTDKKTVSSKISRVRVHDKREKYHNKETTLL